MEWKPGSFAGLLFSPSSRPFLHLSSHQPVTHHVPTGPCPLMSRFLLPSSLGPYKLDLGNVLYAPCCWRDPQVTEALGTGGRGRAQEGAVPVPLKHSSFHPRCHSSTFLPPCPLPQFLSPISPAPSGTAHPLGLDEGAASRAASCRAVRQVLLFGLRQPAPRTVPQEGQAVPGMKVGMECEYMP